MPILIEGKKEGGSEERREGKKEGNGEKDKGEEREEKEKSLGHMSQDVRSPLFSISNCKNNLIFMMTKFLGY